LEVVRQGQKDADDEEGQADDGDRKEIADPVLPQAVQGFLQEVLELGNG
jgi:hypothetical protein